MRKMKRTTVDAIISYGIVTIAFIIAQSMINNGAMTRALKGQMIPICVYIVMAVSLNLVVGISGELSLGHAGFMSIGAFTGAIVSTWLLGAMNVQNTTVRLIIALVSGGILAGAAGALIGIPVLRLRGDYLAIVTLAFGEIIRSILNCLYFSLDNGQLYVSFNSPDIPGKLIVSGPAGTKAIKTISTFPAGFVLILITLFVVLNLINSRSGRAIMASRDNRIAAEAMGVNVTKYKMMAFVTSAFLAGMAGALYGLNFSTFTAAKFKFDTSILVLVFVVLGGIGNIWGSVIAATLLTVLPELLRAFSDYRMLVYAIVLILVMLATNNPTIRSLIVRMKNSVQQKDGIHQAQGGTER